MADNNNPTIAERANGPFLAKNISSFVGDDGSDLETKAVMVLCRCGHSKNKPFCDGSHKTAGFQSRGGKPAGRDRLISYEGAQVTVTFNPRLCSHAAVCARLAGHIFDETQRPWIIPDNGTVAEIEAVITACPSGALAITSQAHRIPDRAEITVEKNGPYWVTGPKLEAQSSGEGASLEKYVLCRCGLSGNKPYCDGSHKDAGWTSGG